jgi:glycosyltransferase involved in cell wall biosynthesis
MTDVSVLTPSYGYGRYIEDAIDSVLGQHDVSVEHVVQDGGSDDETVDILKRFDGLVWASEPDEGQSDALNKALARAGGRWIAWLNADEFYLPRSLAALVEHGERTGADVVYGDCVFVDGGGRVERLLPQHRFSARILREYGCYIPSCAVLMRRGVLGNDPWDAAVKRIMDWDLYLKLLAQGARFTHLAYPVSAFRAHADRITSRPAESYGEENEVASRYGLPSDVYVRWKASRVGRWLHPVYKVLGGAYLRQLGARPLQGHDLRWFSDPRGRETWDALMRRCYPSGRGRARGTEERAITRHEGP